MSDNMRIGLKHFVVFVAALFWLFPRMGIAQDYGFSWDRATIYYVVTDQFLNANPGNDQSGYAISRTVSQTDVGETFGGDFAGLTEKIEEGYFRNLGVDVICVSGLHPSIITASTTGAYTEFWPFDYTAIDPRLGSPQEFRRLIETAHAGGIRVLMEVEISDRKGALSWDSTMAGTGADLSNVLTEIWGEARAGEEIVSLRAFFDRTGYSVKPEYVSVKWLIDWIRDYGVDGYRVADANRVDFGVLAALKAEGRSALRAWKTENPGQSEDDSGFWLLGDVDGHGPVRSEFHDVGLDAVTNYEYTGAVRDIDSTFVRYSNSLNTNPPYSILSFVSSRETNLFDRANLIDAGTRLLLLPGVVQIYYGDETARSPGSTFDPMRRALQAAMNWENADETVRSHWSIMGQFRKNHPAIAIGAHEKLSDEPYAFYRGVQIGRKKDEVIVVLGASGKVRLNVSRYFPDDTVFRDAYTGKISMVSFGEVSFQAGKQGVLLLEPIQ